MRQDKINLVINKMTKAKYEELLSLNEINDNELYYIIDDDGETIVKGYAQEYLDEILPYYVRKDELSAGINDILPVQGNPTVQSQDGLTQLDNIKIGNVIYKVNEMGDTMNLSSDPAPKAQPQTRGLLKGLRAAPVGGTIEVARNQVSISGSYGWHSFIVNDVEFSGYVYADNRTQFQFNSNRPAKQIGNTTELPGKITQISITASDAFNLYTSSEAIVSDYSNATYRGGLMPDASGTAVMTLDTDDRYFVLVHSGSGAKYITSFTVAYGEAVATPVYQLRKITIAGDTWSVEPDLSDYSTTNEVLDEIQISKEETEENLNYKIDELKELLGQSLNANFELIGYYYDSGDSTGDIVVWYYMDPDYGNQADILCYYIYKDETSEEASILFTYI